MRKTPPKRISDKKLKANDGKVPFSSITSPRTPIANGGKPKPNAARKRQTEERNSGPPARRKFVASLPCAACHIVGYSQGAHVMGTAGMGIKKGPTSIAPLCGPHPSILGGMVQGCHRWFDTDKGGFYIQYPAFHPEFAAAATERAWQDHLSRSAA